VAWSAESVEKIDPNSLRPGGGLVDAIVDGKRAGRAVWLLTDLLVPRLRQVAYGPVRRGGYVLVSPAEEAYNACGRAFLRPELAVALDHPSDESMLLLFEKPSAKAQARHLAAAAIHDVLGWPLAGRQGHSCRESVAYHLAYSGRRSASDAVESGRQLWRKLAAWPWWPLGWLGHTTGRLPDGWWTLPEVVANFEGWREPERFLREQAEVRRQVRKRSAAIAHCP
jgi:hypothetical protein